MAKFLKLTDGLNNTELTEFVNSEEVSNVMPYTEEKGFFTKKLTVVGSEITMKNGVVTYVKETPEQIQAMLEGASNV